MSSREKIIERAKHPLVLIVAVGALAAGTTSEYVQHKKPEKDSVYLAQPEKLEAIYAPVAAEIAKDTLNRALDETMPGQIVEDEKIKNAVNVLVDSFDGKNGYSVYVTMLKGKDGSPDPKKPITILIESYYGKTDRVRDQIFIINNERYDGGESWGSSVRSYSKEDQEHPVEESYAEISSDELNRNTAELAEAMSDLALASPNFEDPFPYESPEEKSYVV